MGFLPLPLGVWRGLALFFAFREEEEDDTSSLAGVKSVLKVALITLMNGGDNIGTYVPLFSQAHRADIAIYVIVYYILAGVWCLFAFAVMRQKHVLALAQKYIRIVLPLLYVGLGLYIIIKTSCFPWSIHEIDRKISSHPGKIIIPVVTTVLLVISIGAMIWSKVVRRRKLARNAGAQPPSDDSNAGESPLERTPTQTQVEVRTIEGPLASAVNL
jgi:hypothetical protein